jgi:alkylation response protein AidB-like acyl-CoA dehydrogenase
MAIDLRPSWADEDIDAWRDTVIRFLDDELTPADEEARKRGHIEPSFWKRAGELGMLCTDIPDELGGIGGDFRHEVVIQEEMARRGLYSLNTGVHSIAAHYFMNHGTPEQQAQYIAPFLRGDAKFSISISEPQSGSDAAGGRSTARLDGDEWVLNGNKVWCSGAQLPGATIAILARTSQERYDGFSLFLVPNTTPGLHIKKMNTLVRKSLGTTEFFMDDMRIPKSALLGEVGKGWRYIGEHLDLERLSIAASQVGNARTALDDTKKYLSERDAFGKKLSSYQVLKHRMADDETELAAARLLVYYAADKLARGEPANADVAKAKLFTAKTLFQIAFNGMQALGGYAQLPEYHMERYFREAKHGMVGGGTNEILRSIIAKSMGLGREG